MTTLGVLIQLWRIGEEMSYFAEAFVKPRGRGAVERTPECRSLTSYCRSKGRVKIFNMRGFREEISIFVKNLTHCLIGVTKTTIFGSLIRRYGNFCICCF